MYFGPSPLLPSPGEWGIEDRDVRTVKEALELRQAGIGEICMGELHGRAPDGFDFGNSPFEVSTVNF
jgi:phosphosulfolactate phosphohydrolase-like enzyme